MNGKNGKSKGINIYLLKKMFSKDRLGDLIFIAVLIFFIKYALVRQFDWWDLLFSPIITVILHYVMYAAEIHFENYVENRHKFEITLGFERQLTSVENADLLYNYYAKTISRIIKNAQDLGEVGIIEINNPHMLYNYIIYSAKECKKSVISIDYDLDAWFYVCEEEDFDALKEKWSDVADKADKAEYDTLRDMHKKSVMSRRRIDLTYNISEALIKRFKDTPALKVKRIVVLQSNSLGVKETIILQALSRINSISKRRVNNKILILDSMKNTDKLQLLDDLQDVVIFDNQVAYKEYLKSNNEKSSEVIIDRKKIDEICKHFNELFSIAKTIEVDSHD